MTEKKPRLLFLIILISYASMGALVYTPSLPHLARYFGISPGTAQRTLSIYLVGYLVGQLIFPPLKSRYGRKPALYTGISISFVGIILCILSGHTHSFSLMMVGRFVAAAGASGPFVTTFTIINDVYHGSEARRVLAYVTSSFAFLPALGIVLGGFLTQYLGWVSVFYFLLVWGVVALLAAYALPETAPSLDLEALKPRRIVRWYVQGFSHPLLVIYGVIVGLNSALYYSYASEAPFIAAHSLGLTSDQYSLFSLICSGALLIGTVMAGKLSHLTSARGAVKIGTTISAFFAVCFFFLFLFGVVTWWSLFIPPAFIFMGFCFSFASAVTLSTSQIDDKPTASAVMGFLNLSVIVAVSFLIGGVAGISILALPVIYLIDLTLIILLFVYAGRYERRLSV